MSNGLPAQLEQWDLPVPLQRAIPIVCPNDRITVNRQSLAGRPAPLPTGISRPLSISKA